MNRSTPQSEESFIWVEQPPLSTRCELCGAFIRHSFDENDSQVFLSLPYQIRTIKIFDGGRTYAKVHHSAIHVCQSAFATEPNSIRGASVGVAALL